METLTVRTANAEDAIEVAEVHVRAWKSAYRGLLPDTYLDSLQAQERADRYTFASSDPDAPRTLLASSEGRVRGFASFGPARDEDTPGAGELYALYVDPAIWRRGVGRALMERVDIDLRATGASEAILWVLVGNERAERFYRAGGWRSDGRRRTEDFWGVTAEVIRYRRPLR